MRKYVIIKNNRVIRLGECGEISEITLDDGEAFHLTKSTFLVGDRIFLGNQGSVLPDDGYLEESVFQAWQLALAAGLAVGGAGSAIYFLLAGG